MQQFASLFLYGLSLVLLAYPVYRYYVAGEPLASLRNVALLGFVVFQTHSGAYYLKIDNFEPWLVMNPGRTGFIFSMMCLVFVVTYLASYNWGWPAKQLSRKLPRSQLEPNDLTILSLSVLTVFLGAALKFGQVLLGPLSSHANIIADGLMAYAAGMAAWSWGKRLYNPAVLSVALSVIAVALVVSIWGQYGRRGLLTALGGAGWGFYYARLRHLSPLIILPLGAMLVTPMLIALLLFTSVRNIDERDTGLGLVQRIATQGSLQKGYDITFGSADPAAKGAFWVIENYPGGDFEIQYFDQITYALLLWVPRDWWEGKPTPLSLSLSIDADIKGVAQGVITLPPGIVGNAAAEGGWIALLAYAWFYAFWLRLFDEYGQSTVHNPLVILAVGTSLGQLLGVFRGNPATFLAISIVGITASIFYGHLFGKLIQSRTERYALSMGGAWSEPAYEGVWDEEQASAEAEHGSVVEGEWAEGYDDWDDQPRQ